MKRYSQLTIIQKINFKSFCVNQRISMFGKDYLTPMYFLMTVDAVFVDMPLYDFQYNTLRNISIK